MNRQWLDSSRVSPPDESPMNEMTISLDEIISVIRRRVRIILSVAVLCVVLAGIYVFSAKPVYQGKAVILIDPTNQQQVLGNSPSDAILLKDNLVVESEIEVIRSGELLKQVAKKQNIYSDPDYTTSSLLSLAKGWIYEQLQFSEPVSDASRNRSVFESFRENVSAKRIGLTYAIQINYQSVSPERAAEVTNAIAQGYLEDKLEIRFSATKRTSEWLRQRLSTLQNEVKVSERAVELFKEENDIVDTSAGLVTDQQLSELNSQLILARAKMATAKARFDRIQIIIQEKNADAALADVLSSPEIISLRRKYATFQNQTRKFEDKYGANHLATKNARAEVLRIQTLILEEMKRIEQSYESAYIIAKSRVNAFEKELDKQKGVYVFSGQKQIKLRELERQANATRELYKSLLEGFRNSSERETLPTNNARIIELSDPPIIPVKPKKRLILILALVFGIAAGTGLAFLRETLDKLVWTPESIEKLTGQNNLGLIPELQIKFPKTKRKRSRSKEPVEEQDTEATTLQFLAPNVLAPFQETLSDRFSHLSEVLRNILVSLTLSNKNSEQKEAKVITFVSTVPNEGKTTLSILQALYQSAGNHRTLLIDSDFRRPFLTEMLAPGAPRGICELALDSNPDLKRYIWRDEKSGLDFLPASRLNSRINANDIFINGDVDRIIGWFREHYDYIIIDLPPILIIPDVRVLSETIDHIVYVVEWGKIHQQSIAEALKSSPELNDLIIGSVLNKVNIKKIKKYGGYYYGSNYYYD